MASGSASKGRGRGQQDEELSPYQLELIQSLEVDINLCKSHKVPNLQVAYAKYLAYTAAVDKLQELIDANKWQGPKPNDGDLQRLFFSVQMWHSNYKKYFTDIARFPELEEWLRNGKHQEGRAIFGGAARVSPYLWADLTAYLEANSVGGSKVKGKGKAVVVEEEKEKRKHKKKKSKKVEDDDDV